MGMLNVHCLKSDGLIGEVSSLYLLAVKET